MLPHNLKMLQAKSKLLYIAMLPDSNDRAEALNKWFDGHIRDYHVGITHTKIHVEHLKGAYPEFLEHDGKRASYDIGLRLYKDEVMQLREVHGANTYPEDYVDGDKPWWLWERRYRLDLAVFCP